MATKAARAKEGLVVPQAEWDRLNGEVGGALQDLLQIGDLIKKIHGLG